MDFIMCKDRVFVLKFERGGRSPKVGKAEIYLAGIIPKC